MKSNLILKTITSMLALVWTISANAGQSGNGGNSVVCKNNQGQVTKAEIFDLYEGRVLKGLHYQERTDSYEQQARQLIVTLAQSLGQHADTDGGVQDLLERNLKHLIFLPTGTGLKPIPDGAEFILPKGCEMIQTANFHDFGHIYIDSDIWNVLSETQRAALLVHETVYEYLRDPGPKGNFVEVNSIRTRRAVSLLFAGTLFPGLEDFKNSDGRKPLLCQTNDALEADRPSTTFYIYPSQDGRLVFQFLNLRDRNLLTRTSLTSRPLNISNWPPSFPIMANGELDSLIDFDSYVSINWWPQDPSHSHILVRDVDGQESNESFVCN